ncbi:MAG: phage tail family protein [Methanobrevibacter sp.]|nr:phage tail family protein [Methanobrevibacter sp.]
MRVMIGTTAENYILGEGKVQLQSIQGLDSPPIRNNAGNWSGQDGGYMSAQLYAAREITIHGFYIDDEISCVGKKSVRSEFLNFLRIRKLYPLFFELNNGEIFYTDAYLEDIKCDLENVGYGEYQITFYCPDSALKKAERMGDVNSSIYSALIYNNPFEMGAGHLVPETLKVLFREGQSSTEINYVGSEDSWPTITMNGVVTAPITFTNVTTGQYITLLRDVPADSVLKVDMKTKQVTIDGKSATLYVDETSEWWKLSAGKSVILLTSGDITDTASATIQWTNNYSSI